MGSHGTAGIGAKAWRVRGVPGDPRTWWTGGMGVTVRPGSRVCNPPILSCLLLVFPTLPCDEQLWARHGQGNANFLYAANLAWAAWATSLLLTLVRGGVAVDATNED